VYPRLVAAEHLPAFEMRKLGTGSAALDQMLGGGIDKGTSTLVVGAPGTGKSSLAMQFALAAVERGETAALFIFDEGVATLRSRCEGLGMDVGDAMASGRLQIRQIDPAEMSPGEFAQAIRDAVAIRHAAVVVIDSLNGYLNAMPDDRFLIAQLHELLSYLGQSGVATMLVGAQHGLIGTQMQSPVDASYLADAVLMLRYYELDGEVRQAISVIKRRGGAHERFIRSFSMSECGIEIGEPLRNYRGILTGIPVPLNDDRPLR
jgi:circadian clock protein KaiC